MQLNQAKPEPRPRVVIAVAAERSDEFIWSQMAQLPELFNAGPIAVKLAFYGREVSPPARPYMSTRWATDASDLASLVADARTRCVCGCFLYVSSILEEALREAQQSSVQAVMIIAAGCTLTTSRIPLRLPRS
jgi:hypothetical protein